MKRQADLSAKGRKTKLKDFFSVVYFHHAFILSSFREGSKDQTIEKPTVVLVNKSLTHVNLL